MATPAPVLSMPSPTKPSHRLTGAYLTPSQIESVLTVALRHNRRSHLMFLFGYLHGARCSEIAHLKIGDVNVEQNTVRIERGKGSETNIQALAKFGRNELFNERAAFIEWIQIRRKEGATDADFMFEGRKPSEAISRSAIFRMFQAVAEEAGIPPTHRHVHVLKHSLGRNLMQANVTLPLIKKQLGHVSLTATQVYTTATDADASAATHEALSKLFSRKGLR
jgi:integrase